MGKICLDQMINNDGIASLNIALTQLNVVLSNYKKISYEYQYAAKKNIDLLILPESTFITVQEVENFASETLNCKTTVVTGQDNKIFIIYGGMVREEEFNQQNYYISVEINDLRILIIANTFKADVKNAKKHDFIISLQNIPYLNIMNSGILQAAQKISQELEAPLIQVSKVDMQQETMFSGYSFIISNTGKLIADIPEWYEKTINTKWQCKEDKYDFIRNVKLNKPYSKEESIYQALIMGIRSYIKKHNFDSAILGLSGGIDSTFTLAVAADAMGVEKVSAILMPSLYTKESSIQDATKYVENIGIECNIIPIDKILTNVKEELKSLFSDMPEDKTEENMQARIRGLILMSVSNKFNRLVLCTGNKSEIAVGYCTLYGDTCGGYAPIADLYKTEIYKLSNWRNSNIPFGGLINQTDIIPQNIINKAPSAELKPEQKDQDDLPPYSELDKILYRLIDEQKKPDQLFGYHDKETVTKIVRLYQNATFKHRYLPPTIKIPKILMNKK